MRLSHALSILNSEIFNLKSALCLCVPVAIVLSLPACSVERRKSDTELALNPQEAAGRRVYHPRQERAEYERCFQKALPPHQRTASE